MLSPYDIVADARMFFFKKERRPAVGFWGNAQWNRSSGLSFAERVSIWSPLDLRGHGESDWSHMVAGDANDAFNHAVFEFLERWPPIPFDQTIQSSTP